MNWTETFERGGVARLGAACAFAYIVYRYVADLLVRSGGKRGLV